LFISLRIISINTALPRNISISAKVPELRIIKWCCFRHLLVQYT